MEETNATMQLSRENQRSHLPHKKSCIHITVKSYRTPKKYKTETEMKKLKKQQKGEKLNRKKKQVRKKKLFKSGAKSTANIS